MRCPSIHLVHGYAGCSFQFNFLLDFISLHAPHVYPWLQQVATMVIAPPQSGQKGSISISSNSVKASHVLQKNSIPSGVVSFLITELQVRHTRCFMTASLSFIGFSGHGTQYAELIFGNT
jgi:hypothetical protein